MDCKLLNSKEIKSIFKTLKELRSRFGLAQTLQHAAFRFINRFCHFDCLHIIALDRENLKPPDPVKTARLSTKVATLEELKEMEEQGYWGLPEKTEDYFNRGHICLLSYIDDKLAGYTWALGSGNPTLVMGLTVSVPHEYLYNFCGFTHSNYRGYGLQSFRHYALLNDPRWKYKKGLLGFVVHTNRSSRRGQDKSGYRTIGKIYIIGRGHKLYAHIGKNLRSMGIKRIKAVPTKDEDR